MLECLNLFLTLTCLKHCVFIPKSNEFKLFKMASKILGTLTTVWICNLRLLWNLWITHTKSKIQATRRSKYAAQFVPEVLLHPLSLWWAPNAILCLGEALFFCDTVLYSLLVWHRTHSIICSIAFFRPPYCTFTRGGCNDGFTYISARWWTPYSKNYVFIFEATSPRRGDCLIRNT